jgi:hypothetical protein
MRYIIVHAVTLFVRTMLDIRNDTLLSRSSTLLVPYYCYYLVIR